MSGEVNDDLATHRISKKYRTWNLDDSDPVGKNISQLVDVQSISGLVTLPEAWKLRRPNIEIRGQSMQCWQHVVG
jgi:hypothetical protein